QAHHLSPNGGAGRRPRVRAPGSPRALPDGRRAAPGRRAPPRGGRAAAPGPARRSSRAARAALRSRGGNDRRARRRDGPGAAHRAPRRGGARPRRGDDAHARGPPRAPHPPAALRSPPGPRWAGDGGEHGGGTTRVDVRPDRRGDRRVSRPGGQLEDVMTEIGRALVRELGADRVAEDAATLAAHRTDYWILAHLRARQGRLAGGPACVVRPHSTAEVAAAVRTAQRLGVAVVPYGAGSGVVGGATPPDRSLVIDLSAMNALLEVHDTALYACAQAGMLGSEGTLGVITEVTLRLHPLPERRELASFAFSTFHDGLEAMRRIVRVGWRPAVLRLYDAPEAARNFSAWAAADACLLLVVSEG